MNTEAAEMVHLSLFIRLICQTRQYIVLSVSSIALIDAIKLTCVRTSDG